MMARFVISPILGRLASQHSCALISRYSQISSGNKPSESTDSSSGNTHLEDRSSKPEQENDAPGTQKSTEELLKESQSDTPAEPTADFPSDMGGAYWKKWKSYNAWKRSQVKHAHRPRVDPEDTTILLFPGQGSQFVGMGAGLLEYPNVPELYHVASSILGYDLLDICVNGPAEMLNKTVHQQPALLVTSVAAIEKLRHEKPSAIENCVSAAGFSVGEYAALVFSGALTFEDAVQLVKVRAEAMQAASEATPSGMMTAFLGPQSKVKYACHMARRYCSERLNMEDPVCEIANYLYPECKVIAGNSEALDFIEKNRREFGIKRLKHLPVSGAFHTNLMRPAKYELKTALKKCSLEVPVVPVHGNVSGYRYTKTDVMKRLLVEQIYKPVKWEQIIHMLYSRPDGDHFPDTYEVGPGNQLGTLLKLTNRKGFDRYKNVSV